MNDDEAKVWAELGRRVARFEADLRQAGLFVVERWDVAHRRLDLFITTDRPPPSRLDGRGYRAGWVGELQEAPGEPIDPNPELL